jgi:hypothetical protein
MVRGFLKPNNGRFFDFLQNPATSEVFHWFALTNHCLAI